MTDERRIDLYKRGLSLVPPSLDEVSSGLASNDVVVRYIWSARTDYMPTPDQIALGLSDSSMIVRRTWMRRTDYEITTEQVSDGLEDESWEVRVALLRRGDWTPSQDQINRGLTDYVPQVVFEWNRRVLLDTDSILYSAETEYMSL